MPWKVELPPMVWFHGIQSRITVGPGPGWLRTWLPWATFAHIMRWVLMTAFGMPVEPLVNSSLPTVSGVMASMEACTAGVTGVRASASKAWLVMPSAARSTCTTTSPSSWPAACSAFSAFWNCTPSCTSTAAGLTRLNR